MIGSGDPQERGPPGTAFGRGGPPGIPVVPGGNPPEQDTMIPLMGSSVSVSADRSNGSKIRKSNKLRLMRCKGSTLYDVIS